MGKLSQLWITLHSSFWFVPLIFIAGSIALASAMIEVESSESNQWLAEWPRLFGAEPQGARQILATLAGSMMTVMGITFSMTLVSLTMASSQYTSRILRNYMRSRITQITLGVFSGIFVYCLILLRSIRGGELEYVPTMGVFVAVFMAICSVCVLIYFIHHIASSIQAANIIASISDETIAVVERLFPDTQMDETDEISARDDGLHLPEQKAWYAVPATVSGYIQTMDEDALIDLSKKCDTTIRMEHGIGAFVVKNVALASLAMNSPPDQEIISKLNDAFGMSRQRTIEQDPVFGIGQIVDMALKALSPGINETSTAVMCVDYLSVIMTRLAARQLPSACRYDGEVLRLITKRQNFDALLAESFDQIRNGAKGNVAILMRMLDGIQAIASQTIDQNRRQALGDQVDGIAELGDRTLESTIDRAKMNTRLRHVRESLMAGTTTDQVCAQG